MTNRLLVIVVATLALGAGMFLSTWQRSSAPPPVYTANNIDLTGEQRPEFRLGSVDGSFVGPQDFSGKTLLINFWATWCVPCREEMPMLTAVQSEYAQAGLQIVGIALDDVESVRTFVAELGVSYPMLVGEADVMETSRDYGNVTGVLPYSVLIDRSGKIIWQVAGELNEQELRQRLEKFL